MLIIMKFVYILSLFLACYMPVKAQFPDSICGRKVTYDSAGRMLGWFMPEKPGAVYDQVIRLSSEFLLEAPIEPSTGLPMY